MKKMIVVGIIILLIGVNIGSTFAGDIDVKTMSSVGFDGNTLYVGGSGANNYTKIQDAIDNSSDGDTVFVYDDSSPYYEDVVVDKSIFLIGEDKNTTIIEGSDASNVVVLSEKFITINGFTINGGRLGPYAHIKIYSDNNVISNTIITSGNPQYGMYFEESSYNEVFNNVINNRDTGIWFTSKSDNNIIRNNEVINGRIGIGIKGNWPQRAENNTISRNYASNCGIWGHVVGNTTIYENTLSDSRVGVDLGSSDKCLICGNTFYRNFCGIQNAGGSAEITNNNFFSTFFQLRQIQEKHGLIIIGGDQGIYLN